jgi:hypothetical protein
MTPQIVFAYNHLSRKAAIYGEVDDHGTVAFAVQALPDSPIRGTELFRRMMLAFGDEARAIQGVWRKGTEPSINIDKVNELTRAGMTLEKAICQTWTVTRAALLGFTKAKVLGDAVGSPGAYTKIDVLIEK